MSKKFFEKIDLVLGGLAATTLFALMAITCADVVGRYFFNSPIQGGMELTELLVAATILSALPVVSRHDEHIVIDLIDNVLPKWALNIPCRLAALVSSIAFAVLSWRLWIRGDQLQVGETTAVLNLPMAPFAYTMAILVAINVPICLFLVFNPSRSSLDLEGSAL